jgi:hypothetical protein
MHRAVLIVLAALAAAPPGAAAPAAPLDAARVRLVACHTGADPVARLVTVEATMRALPGSVRMQMRFELYRRRGGRFVAMAGPGLGSWNDATPGVARLRFRKTIANLPVPGAYRVLVRYRWADASGHELTTARRVTPTCGEPDPRPDLRPRSVDVTPGPDPESRTYRVTVHNAGRSPAPDFDVVLVVDGVRRPAVTVPGLAAGASATVSIAGPRCPAGGSLQAIVDPDNRVDESVKANNARTFPCT